MDTVLKVANSVVNEMIPGMITLGSYRSPRTCC